MKLPLIIKNIAVLGIILGLSGCVPKYPENEKPKLLETPSVNQKETVSFEGQDFEQGWPANNWWEVFNDSTLTFLIDEALKENPTIKKAHASLERARALATKSKAPLFPNLFFDAKDNWEYLSKNGQWAPLGFGGVSFNIIDVEFALNYELDLFGKNRKTYLAAVGRANAEKAQSYYTRLLITSSVAGAYFSLKCNLLREKVMGSIKEDKLLLLKLASDRQNHALDGEISTLKVQEEVKEIEVAIHALRNQIAIEKHFLLSLIGKGPDEPLELADLNLPLHAKIPFPKQINLELLTRRSDLMVEIWKINAAANEVGAAKAEFYPNINLMAIGGVESLQWNNLFSIQSKNGNFNPVISLPVFTGNELRSNLKAKRKAFEEAVFSYNEKILDAVREVADKFNTLAIASQKLVLQEEKTAYAQKVLFLQKERLQHGIDNAFDVLFSREKLLREELTLIGTQQENLLSTLQLIQALGGGYEASGKEGPPGGPHV